MSAPGTRKPAEILDEYPLEVRNIAKAVLDAELGKLHLQLPRNIKEQIREIVEREATRIEQEEGSEP